MPSEIVPRTSGRGALIAHNTKAGKGESSFVQSLWETESIRAVLLRGTGSGRALANKPTTQANSETLTWCLGFRLTHYMTHTHTHLYRKGD